MFQLIKLQQRVVIQIISFKTLSLALLFRQIMQERSEKEKYIFDIFTFEGLMFNIHKLP